MLNLVRCTIISAVSNDYVDAFLLSESSFFVWPTKVILKTCGTTTLLRAVPELLRIARDAGFNNIVNLFYSRKNFFYPQEQLQPHATWSDEVKFLDLITPGSGYVLGKTNGDHWNLFVTDGPQCVDINSSFLGETLPKRVPHANDQTLEILMTDLCPKKMAQFFKSNMTAQEVTQNSGIAALFPQAEIDDFLFDPMGYSCNALLTEGYFTIHITPQPQCCFVSFETNLFIHEHLVVRVLNLFQPKSFTITLFGGQKDHLYSKGTVEEHMVPRTIAGCGRTSKARYELENGYAVTFAHYASQDQDEGTGRGQVTDVREAVS